MFDFIKLCNRFEKMSAIERAAVIADKSIGVVAGLNRLNNEHLDIANVLATFLVGAVACDGEINEVEYLLVYPSLVQIFGSDFDFESTKNCFKSGDGKKAIKECTDELAAILSRGDDNLKTDAITLCLCAVSVDGKVSMKERSYVKKLFKRITA